MDKVALATLGCKVNQYETELIREQLEKSGFNPVSFGEKAGLYIINTCSVTEKAAQKSIELIKKARNRSSLLVVTGCYAEAEKEKLREMFPWIDLVVGNKEKSNIGNIINGNGKNHQEKETYIGGFNAHNRAFVKVEDGCNQFCTYCIIPYVRGKEIRSRSLSEVLREMENLAEQGFKEIVLTGVNLGLYGTDLNPQVKLVGLLKKAECLKEKTRIRLSSLEPHLLSMELIDFIAQSPWICPHLHLPLQSGDAEILKKMGRRYTLEEYRRLLRKVRKKILSVAITSDVMVGFPGEEESNFSNTYRFLEEMKFSRLHIFRFSPRKGTRAYSIKPGIEEKVKKERSKLLRDLGNKLSQDFASQFLGKTLTVLAEDQPDTESGLLLGYTENYIPVLFKGKEELKNKLIRIRLSEIKEGRALGRVEELLQ
ncbi:MAG: tRNA (N(6)-L-threonylcarbamoyladenosine(37)-C(2))-methylthiotransferase MtaB [Clostridia bacterium]|jgi:threonylcarbamoyladenosine tRNA methylthiotransferase MtaB|nr:tRNA (N(6)-L-threonylcarbamoyladenosine(37)-C(2))-methylthiotransferase MtaB [Clostridia bacterium]